MTRPGVVVEVAFVEDPFGALVWTDVTSWVRRISGHRGKAHLYGSMQAGSCTVVLDNRDARFDPVNTASPYYPYVLPMRPIRVRTTGVDAYGVFSGFVDGWPPTYLGSVDAEVAVKATDGFKALNLARVSGVFTQELSGARVEAVLDAMGWPADRRTVDPGNSLIQNITLDGDRPLEHLLKVADSELGLFFMDRDGDVRFLDRHGLIGGVLDEAGHTFEGDSFRNPRPSFDDSDLWNEIEVSSQGVATQTASDLTSQGRFGLRTLARTGLLLTSESEQADHAVFVLIGGAEPALRIDSIDLVGDRGSWGRILDRELGSKVLVTFDPPGPGDVVSQPSFVEGINFDLVPNGPWTWTWSLVAMDRRADFWILGDSYQGQLGVTTRLAY